MNTAAGLRPTANRDGGAASRCSCPGGRRERGRSNRRTPAGHRRRARDVCPPGSRALETRIHGDISDLGRRGPGAARRDGLRRHRRRPEHARDVWPRRRKLGGGQSARHPRRRHNGFRQSGDGRRGHPLRGLRLCDQTVRDRGDRSDARARGRISTAGGRGPALAASCRRWSGCIGNPARGDGAPRRQPGHAAHLRHDLARGRHRRIDPGDGGKRNRQGARRARSP